MLKTTVFFIFMCITWHSFSQAIIKQEIPERIVVLTFDDAVKSHYLHVAPLLKKYGFGATFFVCEFPPDFSDTSKYMSWKQIKSLNDLGFEIGNHTRNHKHVNKLSDTEFAYELSYIEKVCDSLQIDKPVTFAYPGYDVDSSAINVLAGKHYKFARSGGNRAYDPLKDHPYLIPGFTTLPGNKTFIMEALQSQAPGKITILTIHGVPDTAHNWVSTDPETFQEYLGYLYEHHYKVISLKSLSEYINTDLAIKKIKPDLSKEKNK